MDHEDYSLTALEAFQESFIQQNSAPIAELLSDDFICISSKNELKQKMKCSNG